MVEHPVVVFLRQAHERAEGLAQAATPDPWTVHPYDWTSSFDASIGHYFEADVVGGGHEGGGVVDMADAEFIAANSPAVVLRRVAAERQILAEHGGTHGVCRVCSTPVARGSVRWPCRTVLLLAEAWGWTEGVQERAEDVPAAYAAARAGAAQSLRESADWARQQSGVGWSMYGVLCDLQADLLERPSPFAALAAELRQSRGPGGRLSPPAVPGGCYEASFGRVHIRPGCRCTRQ